MTESYWSLVEPVWDRISIYDGVDTFLQQFAEATEKQRVLFASHWAQSQIMNGGLGQFFSNSTGVLAPEAAEAFEAIGMRNCASILRRSMRFFGDPYPRDRSMREQRLEDFHKEFGEDAIPLLEFEDAMATEIEDENGGFWNAANRYAEER